MSLVPKAIRSLLEEPEQSRAARVRAWNVLQQLRKILIEEANVRIAPTRNKRFEAEGELLAHGLRSAIADRNAAITRLAAAARVDKAAFREPS